MDEATGSVLDDGDLSIANDVVLNSGPVSSKIGNSNPRYLAAPEFVFRETNLFQRKISDGSSGDIHE